MARWYLLVINFWDCQARLPAAITYFTKGFLFKTSNCCYNNIDTSFFQINFSKWQGDIFWWSIFGIVKQDYLRQSITLPRASCSTLLTVATTISTLLCSKLSSPNGKMTHLLVTIFGIVKQELWIVKQKPWNQWSKPK